MMKKNLIVKRGNVKECNLIKFNKYLSIPNKEVKSFKHNYIDDILIIKLYNDQIITISNFTFYDFSKIEYFIITGIKKDLQGRRLEYEYVDFESLGGV